MLGYPGDPTHTASRGISGLSLWKPFCDFSGYSQPEVKGALRFQWDGDCRGNIWSGGGVGAGFIPNSYLQLLTLSLSALLSSFPRDAGSANTLNNPQSH